MSTLEVKERIAQMTPTERDDIIAYIHSLHDDEPFTLTSNEIAELDRRVLAYRVTRHEL